MENLDISKRISTFMEKKKIEILQSIKQENHLLIDFKELELFDPILADVLLESPKNILNEMNDNILKSLKEDESPVNTRFKNLPESRNLKIRHLRQTHMNKLWTIDSVVKTASEIKPRISEAQFECPECGTRITIIQEEQILKKPEICDCGRRGDFELVGKKMIDFRWLNVVDPFELMEGDNPGELRVLLKEDLTTIQMQRDTDPGARIKIIGMLKEIPKRIKGRLATDSDFYLDAVYVDKGEVNFDDFIITEEEENIIKEYSKDPKVFEKLTASVAPYIYGFDDIKESIILQMFGGAVHKAPDNSRTRGNIHILLTGDPGVGKTVIMKIVSETMPRSKYVSGSGVTGAGLTATVRKDEVIGSWVLEAGALILCNKSMIAIDEFDKMSKDDQIAMHEAMSVETVSIAKASIVATLPAETAVLAGANPIYGRYDPYESIVKQISIPDTLLSRFDLKFALRDMPDESRDSDLAEHIIRSRSNPESMLAPIPRFMMKKYIAYAKRKVPKIGLTEPAAKKLKEFYIKMRGSGKEMGKDIVSITLRQYEALIRLAEASAKIRLSTEVEIEDADRAIRLMTVSLNQLGYDEESGLIDIDKTESGISSSKRDRIKQVLSMIESLDKGDGTAYQDILAEGENRGMEIDEIQDLIENLKRDGTIYEPGIGKFKRT